MPNFFNALSEESIVSACSHCRTETMLVPRRLACRLHPTADGINSGERVSGYVAVSAADADVGVNVR
jgi:hypothetical protein